ncbi:hypothetical protein A3Q56_06404, partial [Intoshia linei]
MDSIKKLTKSLQELIKFKTIDVIK